MNSAGKATGLLRVVLTSSCAAVKGANNAAPPKNGKFYNEEDWNETSTVENGEPYFASKVQAEQAAWQIAKEMNIDLVTINPQFIMGPLLSSRTDGTSVGYMRVRFYFIFLSERKGEFNYFNDCISHYFKIALLITGLGGRYCTEWFSCVGGCERCGTCAHPCGRKP